MAMVDILYTHPETLPVDPAADLRRTSVEEMYDYISGLVLEMKMAGISVSFTDKTVEGRPSEVFVNGRTVAEILEGLEIKTPELSPEESGSKIISFERAPEDWDRSHVEDISDILMKNAISKAYADALHGKVM